ncbi:hypothetical protein HO665_08095 [Streptococcus suis]|nr:hypothetical protein [Streptococcus suis]
MSDEQTKTIVQIEKILNAPTLNLFYSLPPNSKPSKVNPLLENEASFELGDGTIFLANYQGRSPVSLKTTKMLDFLTLQFGKVNNYDNKTDGSTNLCLTVTFSLMEYSKILGKLNPDSASTKKDVRRIVKEALDTIFSMSLETTEKRRKDNVFFSKMRILQSYSYKNSVFIVVFTESFAHYMLSSYVMNFPLNLFQIDERNKNAYSIGRKLSLHQSIYKNKNFGIERRISVRKLLEAAPAIPKIEEVRAKKGGWQSRIIDKLENALDYLHSAEILEFWEYTSTRGVPLTDEQLESLDTYYDYEKLNVHFKMKGFLLE